MYKKNYPDFYSKNPSFDCIRKLIWIFKQENIGFKYLLNNKQNCYIKKTILIYLVKNLGFFHENYVFLTLQKITKIFTTRKKRLKSFLTKNSDFNIKNTSFRIFGYNKSNFYIKNTSFQYLGKNLGFLHLNSVRLAFKKKLLGFLRQENMFKRFLNRNLGFLHQKSHLLTVTKI